MAKYENIEKKRYVPNWSEEVSVIKEVKNTVPWTYAISYLNEKEIFGTFYEKKIYKIQIKNSLELKR